MTIHIEIQGDDGRWHEVPGITSVELHQEQPEQQPTPIQLFIEESRPVRDAYVRVVAAYVEAARPIIETAARSLEAYGRALRAAGLVDQDGRPVRRPDRPAWQSPYGPTRKRH